MSFHGISFIRYLCVCYESTQCPFLYLSKIKLVNMEEIIQLTYGNEMKSGMQIFTVITDAELP